MKYFSIHFSLWHQVTHEFKFSMTSFAFELHTHNKGKQWPKPAWNPLNSKIIGYYSKLKRQQ